MAAIPLVVQDKLDEAVSQGPSGIARRPCTPPVTLSRFAGLDTLLDLNAASIDKLSSLPVLSSEIVVDELIDVLHLRRT